MEQRNELASPAHRQDGFHADGEHDGHAHAAHVQAPHAPRRPTREQLQHIQGWGADLDRKHRPAVPMERTPPRFIDAPEDQPAAQRQEVEVLVSTERPGRTPVFGSVQPPSGLSGAIRRAAFRLTENDVRHWLLLLVADRVNVVEGIGQDLASGKVPNVLAEMGIKAEFRHNPAGLAKKAAVATAVAGMAYLLLKRGNRRR